jgi:hypothetical protein
MTEPHPPERTKHVTDEGTTTVDLGAKKFAGKAPPRPAAPRTAWYDEPHAEQHIRLRGRWLIICGVLMGGLTFVLAVVYDHGFGEDLPLTYALPLYAFSLGGIAVGTLEYLNRPTRRALHRSLSRIDQLELGLIDLVALMEEDKRCTWYQGYAARTRDERGQGTGTENARPLGKYRAGEVLRFRQRGR